MDEKLVNPTSVHCLNGNQEQGTLLLFEGVIKTMLHYIENKVGVVDLAKGQGLVLFDNEFHMKTF